MTYEEISSLPQETLDRLAGMYAHMRILYGNDPASYSPRKWRRVRRWLAKQYFLQLPDDASLEKHLGPQVSDADLLAFLEACGQETDRRIEEQKRALFEAVSHFPEPVRESLWNTREYTEAAWVTKREDTLVLSSDEYSAFRYRFILEGAENLPEALPDCFWHIESLEKTGEGYCLTGFPIAEDWEDRPPLRIPFTAIRYERQVYRVEPDGGLYTPWRTLALVALAICEKAFRSDCPCNAQEEALLPLLTELANLYHSNALPEDRQSGRFPLLAALFGEFGQIRLLPLLSKVEAAKPDSVRRRNLERKLLAKLEEQACEPLWRSLYGKIQESQASYPTRVENDCDPALAAKTRAEVQAHMERLGYQGTYPDFVKEGPLKGIHLAESHGMTYFVGMEKRAVYHIHCLEAWDGSCNVWFLCGTALPRKGEQVPDIWSCMFNAKGRRLYRQVWPLDPRDTPEADLAARVEIAAKKAELRKLTKEEREWDSTFAGGSVGLFLAFLILGGGMFGILMTAGFMVMEFLTALLVGQLASFPELFLTTPWWQLLLFCWLGFGGAMGLITVLAKRK